MAVGLHHCEIAWWGPKSVFNLRSEEVSEAFLSHLCSRDPLQKTLPDMSYKSSLMSVFRAGRKHNKYVAANRESDFTSCGPLNYMRKMVALSCGDTQMTSSNSQQQLVQIL